VATEQESQLLLYASKNGITSPNELANFMAQVGHESGDMNRLQESFRYSSDEAFKNMEKGVTSVLREGRDAAQSAREEALKGHPENLGELMYGGRMGNTSPGEGYKYHGRGFIQLTGKDEYKEAGAYSGLDLVANPDLAANRENAAQIAVSYWKKHVHEAAPEDVVKATRIINGPKMLGLDDREARFSTWKNALTPEVMAGLSKGEVRLPPGPVIANSHHGHGASHQSTADTLRQGMHGEQVQKLQAQLGELGYLDSAVKPDGKFGPATREAVNAYQHDHHLPEVGHAGPATQQAIQADLAPLRQHNSGPLPAVSAMSSLSVAPGLDDPRNALNANHALYNELKTRIPDASEQRLLQFTAACHSNKITAENLGQIHFDRQGGSMTFMTSWPPQPSATVDLKAPSPEPQQSIQQIQQYNQQQTQMMGQIQAQNAQINQQAQQGPMPGGPGR
jgi:putative chitinase